MTWAHWVFFIVALLAAGWAGKEHGQRLGRLYAHKTMDFQSRMIVNLRAQLDLALADVSFYRCCALSGETPNDDLRPSADHSALTQRRKDHEKNASDDPAGNVHQLHPSP